MKNFPNTPTNIPANWVECSGQVLADADSPYDGLTIPDLNGTGGTQRFLRGSTTSGTTGGADSKSGSTGGVQGGTWNGSAGAQSVGNHTHGFSVNVLPSYYEVVWIMRVK